MADPFGAHDVERLRIALLYLEARQVSPRATIIIDLRDEAVDLDLDADTFADGLNLLLELGYIEGPGSDRDGLWLFRKLSRKGIAFVEAARDPDDWVRLKQRHALAI